MSEQFGPAFVQFVNAGGGGGPGGGGGTGGGGGGGGAGAEQPSTMVCPPASGPTESVRITGGAAPHENVTLNPLAHPGAGSTGEQLVPFGIVPPGGQTKYAQ